MSSRDKSAQAIELPQSAELASSARDDCSSMANPYSPAKEVESDVTPAKARITTDPGVKFPSLPRTILRWTVVCCIAAAPSFVMGLDVTQRRTAGMIAGILTFVGIYVGVDLISRHWPIRSNITVRRTLVFVYVTRIVISIVFPVGVFIDMATGIAMTSLMNEPSDQFRRTDSALGGELANFWLAYSMTFVQAMLMNIVLFIWGLICLPFIAFYTSTRSLNDDSITLDKI